MTVTSGSCTVVIDVTVAGEAITVVVLNTVDRGGSSVTVCLVVVTGL